jgi:hypothetical protein
MVGVIAIPSSALFLETDNTSRRDVSDLVLSQISGGLTLTLEPDRCVLPCGCGHSCQLAYTLFYSSKERVATWAVSPFHGSNVSCTLRFEDPVPLKLRPWSPCVEAGRVKGKLSSPVDVTEAEDIGRSGNAVVNLLDGPLLRGSATFGRRSPWKETGTEDDN